MAKAESMLEAAERAYLASAYSQTDNFSLRGVLIDVLNATVVHREKQQGLDGKDYMCQCMCHLNEQQNAVTDACGLHAGMERAAYNNGRTDGKDDLNRVVAQLKMNPQTVEVHDVVNQVRLLQKAAGIVG